MRARTRTLTLLAVGLLVLLGFIAITILDGGPGLVPTEAPALGATVSGPRSQPTILEEPPEAESRISEGAPSEPAKQQLGPAISTEPWDYASKYRGRSPQELAGALGEVRLKRLDLQKKITQQRMDAGEFIKVYRRPGEELDLGKIATPEADRLPGASGNRNIYVRGGGGRDYVEVSGIPAGEYPEFDALQSEEIWLSHQVEDPPTTVSGTSR